MSVVIAFKEIKPKKLKVQAIIDELTKELEAEGKFHQKELGKTTQSWKKDKPKFESLTEVGADSVIVVTGPTGSDKAVNKFMWLNEGTKIRWALMSRNWRSKTRVGKFASGPGRGRVVIAGRRAMTARNIRPRPGIKARNWTTILQKRRKRPFTKRMIQAMRRGAQKVF